MSDKHKIDSDLSGKVLNEASLHEALASLALECSGRQYGSEFVKRRLGLGRELIWLVYKKPVDVACTYHRFDAELQDYLS